MISEVSRDVSSWIVPRAAMMIGMLAFLGGLLTFAPSQAQQLPTPTPSVSVVVVPDLFLRSGPGTGFLPVSSLVRGMVVTPLGRNEDASWVAVRARGVVGWVRRDLVSWSVNLLTLPLIDAAELTVTPSPTFIPPTETPQGSWVSAGDEGVFVRVGPGLTYPPLGILRSGVIVEPVGRTSELDWILIRLDDGFGWVARPLVRWDIDLRSLPVLVRGNLTPSATFTATLTPSATLTATQTATATDTLTPSATSTYTLTPSITPSVTPSATASDTASPIPTLTSTSTPSATATSSPTPAPTDTATLAPSSTSTQTAAPSATPVPTDTATLTPSSTSTQTAAPSATPVPTDTATLTPSSTSTQTAAPSATPVPTDTATLAPSSTSTQTAAPSATATSSPTPVPTDTATLTPSSTSTQTTAPSATASSSPTPAIIAGAVTDAASEPTTQTAAPTASATHTEVLTASATSLSALLDATTALTSTPSATSTATLSPSLTPSESLAGNDGGAPGDGGQIPVELVVGTLSLAGLLGYGLLYWRGAAAAERYSAGFIIRRCPVCQQGELVVETRRERLAGIPRARHIVGCTYCRSVLREAGARRWRYAVDRMDNPQLYAELNGRTVSEDDLRALAERVKQNAPPQVRIPPKPPRFIDDEQAP